MWDWVYRTDWQAWATFSNAIALIIAAALASRTFHSWRRQTLFARHSNTAEEILTAFYDFRFAIDTARRPLTTASQLDEARNILKNEYKQNNPSDQLVTAQAMLEKLKSNSEKVEKIFSLLARSKAVFGNDVYNGLLECVKAQQAFRAHVHAYASDKFNNQQFSEKISKFVWKDYAKITDDPVDPIDSPLDVAETALEEALQFYIRQDLLPNRTSRNSARRDGNANTNPRTT